VKTCWKISELQHRLDQLYFSLSFKLFYVNPKHKEHAYIEQYLRQSSDGSEETRLKSVAVFRIDKPTARPDFLYWLSDITQGDRKLLWYGSKTFMIGNTLTGGFRPSTYSDQMFGRGIYFYDFATEALHACKLRPGEKEAVLLLCEVELGKPCIKRDKPDPEIGAKLEKNPTKFSVIGNGKYSQVAWCDGAEADFAEEMAGVAVPHPSHGRLWRGDFSGQLYNTVSLIFELLFNSLDGLQYHVGGWQAG
jgi:hypothetical protein